MMNNSIRQDDVMGWWEDGRLCDANTNDMPGELNYKDILTREMVENGDDILYFDHETGTQI